jgi:hypothetical protein
MEITVPPKLRCRLHKCSIRRRAALTLTVYRPTAPPVSWMRSLPKRRDSQGRAHSPSKDGRLSTPYARAAAGGLRPLTVSPLRKQDASTRSTALVAELGGNDTSGQSNDSSWPGLSRPSTPSNCRFSGRKATHSPPLPQKSGQLYCVDGRDKPGHDGRRCLRQLAIRRSTPPPTRPAPSRLAKSVV